MGHFNKEKQWIAFELKEPKNRIEEEAPLLFGVSEREKLNLINVEQMVESCCTPIYEYLYFRIDFSTSRSILLNSVKNKQIMIVEQKSAVFFSTCDNKHFQIEYVIFIQKSNQIIHDSSPTPKNSKIDSLLLGAEHKWVGFGVLSIKKPAWIECAFKQASQRAYGGWMLFTVGRWRRILFSALNFILICLFRAKINRSFANTGTNRNKLWQQFMDVERRQTRK